MTSKPQRHRGLADPPAGSTASSSSSSSENAAGNGSNVDGILFKNLVEMVPLVESLMDRRATSSFTRRASVAYTPAPSQLAKANSKGRKTAHSDYGKKQKECGDYALNKSSDNGEVSFEDLSVLSPSQLAVGSLQNDTEEVTLLQEKLEDLRRKFLEKDEALKAAENSVSQMKTIHSMVDELSRHTMEQDLLIKSSNSQLSSAKIKLADKQAALEKLEWEAKTSNTKVEQLQADLDSMDIEINAIMRVFEELSKSDSVAELDIITSFPQLEHLPHIGDLDEAEMAMMEEARLAYEYAIATARVEPSDQRLSAAAEARGRLQSLVKW